MYIKSLLGVRYLVFHLLFFFLCYFSPLVSRSCLFFFLFCCYYLRSPHFTQLTRICIPSCLRISLSLRFIFYSLSIKQQKGKIKNNRTILDNLGVRQAFPPGGDCSLLRTLQHLQTQYPHHHFRHLPSLPPAVQHSSQRYYHFHDHHFQSMGCSTTTSSQE